MTLLYPPVPTDTFATAPDGPLSLPDDAADDYAASRLAQATSLIREREVAWDNRDWTACHRAIRELALFDVDEISAAERVATKGSVG